MCCDLIEWFQKKTTLWKGTGFPAVSSKLQGYLGLSDVPSFDL